MEDYSAVVRYADAVIAAIARNFPEGSSELEDADVWTQEHARRAKVRRTKFVRVQRAKPSAPDVFPCPQCGHEVFRAARPDGGSELLLEWEADADLVFGWTVEPQLQPIAASDDGSGEGPEQDVGWAWFAVRRYSEPSDPCDPLWEELAKQLEIPRYKEHPAHRRTVTRLRTGNAHDAKETERQYAIAWALRDMDPTGQLKWRTASRHPEPLAATGRQPKQSRDGAGKGVRRRRVRKVRQQDLF